MRKPDLVDQVAATAELTRSEADAAVTAVFSEITKALAADDTVNITGFGAFSVKDRAARQGRNPQTGAVIEIKASRQPAFKAGKALKDALQ